MTSDKIISYKKKIGGNIMADLQVYQYDSTKLPYENNTYTTPDFGDLYKTPEKNEPGEWSINSNMQMVDLSHPWGND